MTNSIKIYQSKDELIDELIQFTTKVDEVIEGYRDWPFRKGCFNWTPKKMSLEKLMNDTYTGRMCLSFPKETRNKSNYTDWLKSESQKIDRIREGFCQIEDQHDYDEFILSLAISLSKKLGSQEQHLGKSLKVINLLMKHCYYKIKSEKLDQLKALDKQRFSKVETFLHVPWDRFTLRPLEKIFISENAPRIHTNDSMGYVRDVRIYESLHKFIADICDSAHVARIFYEFLAWDKSRQTENESA
jgi:hypothetical protein